MEEYWINSALKKLKPVNVYPGTKLHCRNRAAKRNYQYWLGNIINISWEPLERQIHGYHRLSWEMWEFTSPEASLRILETEQLLIANWLKWCKSILSLPLTEPWSKCFKLETYEGEYWAQIPFSLHFCWKTRSWKVYYPIYHAQERLFFPRLTSAERWLSKSHWNKIHLFHLLKAVGSAKPSEKEK